MPSFLGEHNRAETDRLASQRKALLSRVLWRWKRRKLMRSIFFTEGQLNQRGKDFIGYLADQAQLGAVGMADSDRAETWRAGRQSYVREIMGWLDVTEADLLILRQSRAADLEE